MASFNKIILVGHLGRDPELRYLPSGGNAVCNFSVATTEKKKNRDGEAEETTTWFKVTAWGRMAELANEYLSKGRQVYVEGRLSLQTYTDREGQTRSSLEVNASDIKFLGDRGQGGGEGETRKATRQEIEKAFKEVEDDIAF